MVGCKSRRFYYLICQLHSSFSYSWISKQSHFHNGAVCAWLHIGGEPEGRRRVPDASVIIIITIIVTDIKRHAPTDRSHYRWHVSRGRDRSAAVTSIVQNDSKLGKISPRWWWSKRDRTDLSGRTAAPEGGLRCRWVFTITIWRRSSIVLSHVLRLFDHRHSNCNSNTTVFHVARNLQFTKLKEAL